MFAREVEDKDSGKHLSLNHLWMEWSDHSTSHRFGPNYDHDSSIRTSSRRRPVRKWKNVLCFSKAHFVRRLLHGPSWMRERPINPSAGS